MVLRIAAGSLTAKALFPRSHVLNAMIQATIGGLL